MKPILVLMAPGFEEIELTTPVDIMRQLEIPVVLAGVEALCVKGVHGMEMKAEMLMADADPEDYDGVVLPGGAGAWTLRDTPAVTRLVRTMHDAGKMVAAICASPMALEAAGIAAGRRITCFPIPEVLNYFTAETVLTEEPAVTDGNIITGRAPGAAFEFAYAIGAYLGKGDALPALQKRLCWH